MPGLEMLPGQLRAQSYPSRPITLLVGGGAGSNPDVMVRPIADRLSVLLGQLVVVDNKPGAGGSLPWRHWRAALRTGTRWRWRQWRRLC